MTHPSRALLLILSLLSPACDDSSDAVADAAEMDESVADAAPLDAAEPLDGAPADATPADSAPPPDAAPDAALPACGDGVIDEGEVCDDGDDNADDEPEACRTDCLARVPPLCLLLEEAPEPDDHTETRALGDAAHEASATVFGARCARRFVLETDAPHRERLPRSPRAFEQPRDLPVVHSGNALFDALHALAVVEAKENSVDAIHTGAFDDGRSWPCPLGGCFQTGAEWTYVWTRDIAYAVDLGLAALDPTRARNSLEFKLSTRRDGEDLQIVQDTGSGGSYPVSTDRVVWAIGAWATLAYLEGEARRAFAARAFEAIRNTLEHDRVIAFDPADGLYRGEQSFLDWREQSYPAWTREDTVHIAMSKALSTNVGHLRALEIGAALALEHEAPEVAARYTEWADALRVAIDARLSLPGQDLYATYTTTTLDPAPAERFDLLGSALSVLAGVGDARRRAGIVAGYPHLPHGAPVMWPQQMEVPIYHNRALWPFVTAYWLRAARAVGNAAALDRGVDSLIRGAALHLTHAENLEMVSGLSWQEDGEMSGPIINSARQLWSVAGYLSMVHDIIFGLEVSPTGVRFRPSITRAQRHDLFADTDALVLQRFAYRGRRLTVVVHLPPLEEGEVTTGVYRVAETRLDGRDVGEAELTPEALSPRSRIDVWLSPEVDGAESQIRQAEDPSDFRNLFAPLNPRVTGVTVDAAGLRVALEPPAHAAEEISLRIYRDGVLVADDLPGDTRAWIDEGARPDGPSYCYTAAARFITSGHESQHALPWCYWGVDAERILTIGADALENEGGEGALNHGRFHYESWGEPDHRLESPPFTPTHDGEHLLQLLAGNGAGPVDTGITCAVKRVTVAEVDGPEVAEGYFIMPHLGAWERWAESSFVPVTLQAGVPYRITIDADERAINMSSFSHFERYIGAGGLGGRHDYVNVAEIRVLARPSAAE